MWGKYALRHGQNGRGRRLRSGVGGLRRLRAAASAAARVWRQTFSGGHVCALNSPLTHHQTPTTSIKCSFKKELKKRKIPLEDYTPHEPSGLRVYDLEEGRGRAVALGDTVTVHFDCIYRGIDAVSSRYARTLGGNRTVAEPLEFVVGEFVSGSVLKTAGDSGGGGLFSGSPGPKPPQALSKAVVGMKPGGKRAVYVDVPELGYPKGNQEIPPGEAFELRIELLK